MFEADIPEGVKQNGQFPSEVVACNGLEAVKQNGSPLQRAAPRNSLEDRELEVAVKADRLLPPSAFLQP